jgi:sensor histidine kinase YesM
MKREKIRLSTETILHLIIWVTLYILVIQFAKTIGPFKKIDGTLIWPVTSGTIINALIFYGIAFFLIPRYSGKKKLAPFLLSVIGLYAFMSLLETFLDHRFFVYYYSSADESFQSQLLINSIFNLLFLSLGLGYGFAKSWLRNEKIRMKLKEEKFNAEMSFLKSQIHPHFLFNMLNTAYASSVRNNDAQTSGIIESISNLMRYMTYDSNADRVDLDKELNYIRDFIRMQKLRFSDDLSAKISFDIQGNTHGKQIAPLILIPFVENAFKHGIKLGNESEIQITCAITENRLAFSTSNKIFQKENPVAAEANGIGLENVKKRLELIYPHTHQLDIRSDNEKFQVSLMLDLTSAL